MNDDKLQFEGEGNPLIKFQTSEIITSLRKGHLYAKTLNYYRALEEETGNDKIGDKFEGKLYLNEGNMKIYEKNGEILYDEKIKGGLFNTKHSNDYVFCMFCVYQSQTKFTFSNEQKRKLLSFGDTALIILDNKEFIERVGKATEKSGFELHQEEVNYYNNSKNDFNDLYYRLKSLEEGIWKIAFWKREKYSYQQEMRFLFIDKESKEKQYDHIELDIGDISDITKVIPTQYLLNGRFEKSL